MVGAASGAGAGTSVRFRCGHGAPATDARITLQRDCPLCMLLAETKRSRGQLLRKVAAGRRTLLSQETHPIVPVSRPAPVGRRTSPW